MRVLVATDFSEPAAEAVRQADAYARSAGAELAICHVVPRLRPELNLEGIPGPFSALDLSERRAIAVRTSVAHLTGRTPDQFEVFVEEGTAYAEIVRRAEVWKSDIVIIGSCGSTGIARLLLGSVADKVVRYAACPVLVVRSDERSGRVLVATDLSDPSLPAVEAGAREARRRGDHLAVMYVVDDSDSSPALGGSMAGLGADDAAQEPAALRGQLAAAMERFSATGDTILVEGPAAAAIVRMSEVLSVKLVVVGTRGRTGLSRVLLGSVAEAVVRSAPCSVLVVRLGAAPSERP